MATVKRSHWQSIQHNIWLIGGVLSLIFAVIFWIMTDTKALTTQSKKVEDTPVSIQPEKVAATTNLGGLTEEVRPLQTTTRLVASGNHLAEFRGTKFIKENNKNYTVELFRSANEDIVKSFILKQKDRKGLIYFRLSGDDQVEQYVLAFGQFKNEKDAKDQLQKLTIPLPKSVKPQVAQFKPFEAYVNDLGSEELVGSNKIYEVKLRSAPVPIIDESLLARLAPKSNTIDPTKATTSTTITRKDQSGKVVDVQRSQTAVDTQRQAENKPASVEKKATDQQISDPFN